MANQIRLKRASGSDPGASDLVTGEIAVRTDTGKLFTKKDDGSVAEISGGGIDDGDKGDITVSSSGATFTIDNGVVSTAKIADDAVTFDKLENVENNRILGRVSSGAGNAEELTQSQVRTLLGLATSATTDTTNASNIGSGTLNTARLPITFTKADRVTIQATGSGNDVLLDAADHIILESGEEEDGSIIFRGNSGNDSYRFAKGGQTSVEGQLSFESLSSTRIFTFPDSAGTIALTSSDITGNAATATALETARTIAGVSFDGTANISLNNNAITNGAGYITATLTNEQVQDIVGGMVSSNTETGITVTYQDSDGTLDFVVGTLNQDTTGNAATATALETARTIGGTSFDGTGNITPAECTNADTVDSLHASSFVRSDASDTMAGVYTFSQAANEKIILSGSDDPLIRFQEGTTDKAFIQWNSAGFLRLMNQEDDSVLRIKDDIEFSQNNSTYHKVWHAGNDGSGSGLDADTLDGQEGSYYRNASNINAGTLAAARVATLNQDTTGNAATATALETARNIGGVSFDGTGNINLPGVNTSGNQDTSGNAATATKLATARTIAGVSFDGSANISLNNNAITNGAGYITATLTNEQVQDIVGAMVSGNSESGISVTYQDSDGTLDFSVTSQTDNNFTDADHSKLDGIAAGANVGIAASGGEFTGDITTHDVVPDGNNTRDLGSSSARWANLFVNDMHFANSPENLNKVDGTWGDWTLQEGEETIYMLNNRNGKKYKMNLTEIV